MGLASRSYWWILPGIYREMQDVPNIDFICGVRDAVIGG
jgi:hypothetical protein